MTITKPRNRLGRSDGEVCWPPELATAVCEEPPEIDYGGAYTPDAQQATPAESRRYRRASRNPRDVMAENFYQKLMATMIHEPRLCDGIWMRGQPDAGETWMDLALEFFANPICLPQETINARQFAAEWALLYGECMAWASLEVEPNVNACLSDEDRKYIKELTGNLPSQIVARWCNAIFEHCDHKSHTR